MASTSANVRVHKCKNCGHIEIESSSKPIDGKHCDHCEAIMIPCDVVIGIDLSRDRDITTNNIPFNQTRAKKYD